MSKAEIRAIFRMLSGRLSPDTPVQERRDALERLAAGFDIATDVSIQLVSLNDSGLTGEFVVSGDADEGRTILYLHGGGFQIGSSRSYRELATRLSRSASARVLVLDYRRAPEHIYPCAHDDSFEAYRWLLDQGVAAHTIALAGDSAGGNLSVSTALRARDAGLPRPSGIALISPYLDLTNGRPSISERVSRDPFLDGKTFHMIADTCAGDTPRHNPDLSPIFANLTGLPPTLVMVGSEEILHDDAVDFAVLAKQAGVEVQLDVWDGLFHVWPFFGPILEEGRQASDKLGAFLAETFTQRCA
jgi:epsilon-lactone hydrolase